MQQIERDCFSVAKRRSIYIYDVSISGFTRSSIYIYDISSLRVKVAAKFAEKLNQSHENSDTKKESMQQIKAN